MDFSERDLWKRKAEQLNSRRHRRIRFKGPWDDTGIHEWEKFLEENEGNIKNFLNAEIDNFCRGGRNYDPFRQYEDREFPVDADIDSQLCDSFFDRFTGYVDQRVDVRHASSILVYAAQWCIICLHLAMITLKTFYPQTHCQEKS